VKLDLKIPGKIGDVAKKRKPRSRCGRGFGVLNVSFENEIRRT